MPALPLSVRFALWATVAVRGEMDPDDAVVAAHPDVDDITGEPAGRLELLARLRGVGGARRPPPAR